LLVAPLGIAFLFVPQWRRQLRTPGPWVALCVGALVIAPHLNDVLQRGATTIAFATRRLSLGFVQCIEVAIEFLLNCLLAQGIMALIAVAAVGSEPLVRAIVASFRPGTTSRRELFVHAAAFGPVVVVLIAALFGVRSRFLWITPFILTFVIWWAHIAAFVGAPQTPWRARATFGVFAALFVVGYVSVRLLAPQLATRPGYAEMDGPALARLAEQTWARTQSGPIPYIVSLNHQRGRQAAGSIAFDLPYRVRVLENGSQRDSPWIDVEDLKRRGALVVAPTALMPGTTVQGAAVTDIVVLPRPMKHGVGISVPMTFGIIRPGS
jgi:hypothetical protein